MRYSVTLKVAEMTILKCHSTGIGVVTNGPSSISLTLLQFPDFSGLPSFPGTWSPR